MSGKNKLPDRITSDQELYKWCRENVPGFTDVIDRSAFAARYPSMKSGNSIIINLDPHYKHGGTHWVALRISNEAPIVYYKDSFGAPPPAEVVSAIAGSGRGLIYGNRVYQGLNEQNCGKRAAYFLRDMERASRQKKEIEKFEELEI